MNNSTASNTTGYLEDDYHDTAMMTIPVTIPICVIAGLIFVVACVSGLLNGCVLAALSRVERSKLKVKHLIQNTTVANILLPITFAIDLPLLNSAFKITNTKINLCSWAIYYNVWSICVAGQAGCVIALSCDRIYAIAAPMLYHTVGYRAWVRRVVLAGPWAVAFGMWASCVYFTLSFSPMVSADTICQLFTDTHVFILLSRTLEIYLVAMNLLSFLVYIGIFAGVKYQRTRIQKYSDSKLDRGNLSLVVSYFLINITTLCLYLPAPVYSSSVIWLNLSTEEIIASETIARGLNIFFLCNSVIDPLIISYRIRAIREKMPFGIFACIDRK